MQPRLFPSRCVAVALSLAMIGGAVGAAQAGSITVNDGWIWAMPSNVSSGGYFLLTNGTGKRIVLVGASSPACGMLMLHKTETAGGMARMVEVPSIPIAVGAHLSFAPGGYHLMCMDPTPAIKPGNHVAVTLEFEGGTKVTTDFKVRSATGR